MKKQKLDRAIDTASDIVDRVVQRTGGKNGTEPRIPRGEERIIALFPYFVAVCLLIWLGGVAFLGDYSISKMVEVLCLSFTFCFAILGVPCALMMPRGPLSGWGVAAYAFALTAVMWLVSWLMDEYYFAQAIHDMLSVVGIGLPGLIDGIVGFLGTMAVMLFTSIGVTSVISAYIRHYVPGVFVAMQTHAENGTRGKAESFFMVPDIIDVKEVILDPPKGGHLLDTRTSVSIWTYLFVLGLLISSYLFVNPYFLDVMGWKTMLAITLMLSMFTPALILPWQIVRGVGAKVRSDAPRDYYLWHGAKHRLFTTFTAMGAFMMMFLLSVYLGNDVWTIIYNYVTFLVPLMLTAAMYAMLYVNNFERTDRETICKRFEDGKSGREPQGLRKPLNRSRVKEENDMTTADETSPA